MASARFFVIQGGSEGAHAEDRLLADYVRSLAADPEDVIYPYLSGLEQLDWGLAQGELAAALADEPDGLRIIGHSLGGAAILKYLSEGGRAPRIDALYLLAMPYTGRDGEWGDGDFALETDFADRMPDCGRIRLYHSRDDEFIPTSSLDSYAARMPGAIPLLLDGYGHQFTSRPFTELARDLAADRA